MRDTSASQLQALEMSSPWLVALVAMMSLVAVALAVAFIVSSGVGLHLALVTQSLAHSLLATGGGPRWPCPGGLPSC